jgi:hypothetical protein
MRRFWIGLAALAVLPAAAVARDEGSNCGGDAYSFAEVVPARRGPHHKGPLTTVPTTLCADLANQQRFRIDSLSTYGEPSRTRASQGTQTGGPRKFGPPRRY